MSEIICGDSKDVLENLEDASIDMILTSPPYDNLRDYEGFSFDFEIIANQLARILKQGGVLVWVVGDSTIGGSETGTSFKQALYFKQIGLNLHDTMIYLKDACPFPEINRYYPSFEYMFVFSKGRQKTTNLIADKRNKQAGDRIGTSTQREKDGTTRPISANKKEPERTIKPKLPSISKLIKECDRLFSLKVRSKGAWMVDDVLWNRCYTSGYEAPIKKLHCGHYLSRYYKAARWNFDNARPQSIMANMWQRGDPINFRRNLIKEIGEVRVLAVEELRDAPIKLSREFLQNLLTTLKD